MSILSWLKRKVAKPARLLPEDSARKGGPLVLRDGQLQPADAAFSAWTSGNLDAMLAQLGAATHPVDRHFLLMGIVAETYRQRHAAQRRALCISIGRRHLSEMPALLEPLRAAMGGVLPRISTYQHLATALAENGDHSEAIEVCKEALAVGLRDGTKSGFQGRIRRLQEQKARARPSSTSPGKGSKGE